MPLGAVILLTEFSVLSCSTGNTFVSAKLLNCVFSIVIHLQNCMTWPILWTNILPRTKLSVEVWKGSLHVSVLWPKRSYIQIHFFNPPKFPNSNIFFNSWIYLFSAIKIYDVSISISDCCSPVMVMFNFLIKLANVVLVLFCIHLWFKKNYYFRLRLLVYV